MKRLMYIIIAIIVLMNSNTAKCQFAADADGKLNISPVNGNMNYSYPISNNTIDGFAVKVDLIYLSNMQHTAVGGYTFGSKNEWEKLTFTSPGWLIGVNGFAVNVLTKKNKFMNTTIPDTIVKTVTSGSWINDTTYGYTYNTYKIYNGNKYENPLDNISYQYYNTTLVNGYDFCNRMKKLISGYDQDVIRILRADGSELELMNPTRRRDVSSSNSPELYTGYYYENSVNPDGYAVVEFDTVSYFPNYAKAYFDTMPDRNSYLPRKIKYYKGDGLEYVFKEIIIPYGLRPYNKILSNDGINLTPGNVMPTIFYLEEINSDLRNIVSFKREWHYPTNDNIDLTRGRAFITEFANHTINIGNKDMKIQYFDRTININYFALANEYFGADVFKIDKNNSIRVDTNTALDIQDNINPIYYISEISDPENRKTSFGYNDTNSCRTYNFSGQFSNFSVLNLRIDAIIEPTKKIGFEYHRCGSGFISSSNFTNNPTGKLDFNILNGIKKSKKYEMVNYQVGQELEEMTIDYVEPSGNYDRKAIITSTDVVTNKTNSVSFFYKKKSISPFRPDTNTSNTPNMNILLPLETVAEFSDRKYVSNSVYKTYSELGGNSRFYLLPVSNSTKLYYYQHIDSLPNDSIFYPKTEYEYNFDIANTFGGDTSLANNFGQVYIESTEKLLTLHDEEVSPTTTVVFDTIKKVVTEYMHLPDYQISLQRTDTLWNKQKSYEDTKVARYLNNLKTTVSQFDIYTTVTWKLPPINYIPLREIVYDGSNNILGGKSYRYNTTYTSGSNIRRGALLSDSVISKGAEETILNANYSYVGGRKRNLLNTATNMLGIVKKNYYDYESIKVLNNQYPSGNVLYNSNNIGTRSLFNYYHEFEAPVATEEYVRKVDPAGNIYTDTLRLFFEKSFYGQNTGMIDPNGWYYENEYDKNGRILTAWQPFDFPACNSSGYTEIEMENPLFNYKTEVTQIKEELNYLEEKVKQKSINKIDTLENRMLIGKEFGAMLPAGLGTISDTVTQSNIEYVTSFEYISKSFDAIHTNPNITKAYLRLNYVANSANNCVIIKINTNTFSFENRYIVNCPALQLLPDTLTHEKPSSIPMMNLDITSLIDSIKTLAPDTHLKFEIRSLSTDGTIEFVNQSLDQNPTIILKTFGCDKHQDYTSAVKYNDSTRTTTYSAKIDDELHTNSTDFVRTYSEKDGRYTGEIKYFGSDNRILKQCLPIGHPENFSRMDSIVYSLSGNSKVLNVKNTKGEIVSNYFNEFGEIDSIEAVDLTVKSFQKINTKDDIIGQYYYGLVEKRYYSDENEKINLEVYDALGQLREKHTDEYDNDIITYYDYDISGNLIKVTHPDGKYTYYTYDKFNRLIAKNDLNVDSVTYSYNKLGQLRFTQNEKQHKNQLVSYMQYDDLGRITIAGEAKIDKNSLSSANQTRRLTEFLNPDGLYLSGACTSYPTVNATLYRYPDDMPAKEVPTFWTYNSQVSVMSFPEIEDTLENLKKGPYFMHPVNYYNISSDTAADVNYFENISYYPEFVRVVNNYDAMPVREGSIWKEFPEQWKWDSIVPYYAWDRGTKTMRNLKGKKAAVAYRDLTNEPFHYVVFSYDPRGRVQSLLRYTENIGFDAVYYTYNSANQVLSVRVADALKQYVTWYGYDNNGRVDSIWTALSDSGLGIGNNLHYPVMPAKPETADIIYRYNIKGEIDTVHFEPTHLTQIFSYNPRGWLDSMLTINNYNEILFKQSLKRDAVGNIVEQKSMHQDQNEMVQTYMYDGLYRLKQWSNGQDSIDYSYDNMGNRISQTKNLTDLTTYEYGSAFANRLTQTAFNNNFKNYYYDLLGAVSEIETINDKTLKTQEFFTYNGNGTIKQYQKKVMNLTPSDCHNAVNSGGTIDGISYYWRYRYSILGGREQKRLYYSPNGDSLCGTTQNYHTWTYYLLGAAGEQLAVYKGVQVSSPDTANPSNTGSRVYMYHHSYLTGSSLVTLADSTKQFNVLDNLGSVRSVVSVKGGEFTHNDFDYTPFGDTLNTDEESRMGFIGQERDDESRYFAMGARLYDPEIGRFLSVDPLCDKFPEQNAYNYCFNNPLTMKDPSGLEPEDEKGEKVLAWENLYDELLAEQMIMKQLSIQVHLLTMNAMGESRFAYMELMGMSNYCLGGIGAIRGRTGYGMRLIGTEAEKQALKKAIETATGSELFVFKNGIVYGCQRVNFDPIFDTPYSRLVSIICSSAGIDVMFMEHETLEAASKTAVYYPGSKSFPGLTNPTVMIDREKYFLGTMKPDKYYDLNDGWLGENSSAFAQTLERVIAHELLGHVWQYINDIYQYPVKNGLERLVRSMYREGDAITMENTVGSFLGLPERVCYWCRWEDWYGGIYGPKIIDVVFTKKKK